MNDTLLHQADALMHRRSFVAGAKPAETSAIDATDSDAADDADFPVLTEVVEEPAAVAPAPIQSAAEQTLDELIATTLDERIADKLREQHAQLDREIELWLDEQLPQLVARAMDGMAEQIVEQIRQRVRETLLRRGSAAGT